MDPTPGRPVASSDSRSMIRYGEGNILARAYLSINTQQQRRQQEEKGAKTDGFGPLPRICLGKTKNWN